MPQKLKPLSRAEYDAVQAELDVLAVRTANVGNVIGPVFGAAWCDKALALHRGILRLKQQMQDEFNERGERG